MKTPELVIHEIYQEYVQDAPPVNSQIVEETHIQHLLKSAKTISQQVLRLNKQGVAQIDTSSLPKQNQTLLFTITAPAGSSGQLLFKERISAGQTKTTVRKIRERNFVRIDHFKKPMQLFLVVPENHTFFGEITLTAATLSKKP